MKEKKYILYALIFGIILITMSLLVIMGRGTAASVANHVYDASNPKQVCLDVMSGKLKVGIRRNYDENGDEFDNPTYTFLASSGSACNNDEYYNDNVKDTTKGSDYPTYTYFGRSSSNLKHYIEGVDATNNDEYRYFYISNNFQSYDDEDKIKKLNTLKIGEKIFIDVDVTEDNLKLSDYDDVRIKIKYANGTTDRNISKKGAMVYYVITSDDTVYGPYNISETNLLKKIHYVNESADTDSVYDEYELVSDNLNDITIPDETIIKTVRIIPYENNSFQNGLFRIYSIAVDAYQNGGYDNGKEYVSTTNAVTKIRQNITNNMATNGTIKWTMDTGKTMKFYCDICTVFPKTYTSSKTYYGIPYVNANSTTTYEFLSKTNKVTNGNDSYYVFQLPERYLNDEISLNGIEIKKGDLVGDALYLYETSRYEDTGTRYNDMHSTEFTYIENGTSNYLVGQDCGSSVIYAIQKELPSADRASFLGGFNTRVLGQMEIDYDAIEMYLRKNDKIASDKRLDGNDIYDYYTQYIKDTYATDEEGNEDKDFVYNAYGYLKPGDVLYTHGHFRMETGYPHVECNDGTTTDRYTTNFCQTHGGINGETSYVIISETRGNHMNMSTGKDGQDELEINSHVWMEDTGWTMMPDSNFTDIVDVDDFYREGNQKLTNFRFNRKYYFFNLYYGKNESTFDEDMVIEGNAMYLPYRYTSMDKIIDKGSIEIPKVNLALEKDFNNNEVGSFIKDNHKLRGTIISNYMIDKIRIQVNDTKYYIYPSQTNVYSLYDELKDETILNTLSNAETVKVSVFTGPNISEVKNSLNLDGEGFMEILSVTIPTEGETSTSTSTSTPTSTPTSTHEEGTLASVLISNGYTINDDIVTNFTLGETVAAIRTKLGSDVTIETDKSVIATGAIIKKGNETYKVAVKGDITGDGIIEINDVSKLYRYYRNRITMTSEYVKASEVTGDNIIEINDVSKLYRYYRGRINTLG